MCEWVAGRLLEFVFVFLVILSFSFAVYTGFGVYSMNKDISEIKAFIIHPELKK